MDQGIEFADEGVAEVDLDVVFHFQDANVLSGQGAYSTLVSAIMLISVSKDHPRPTPGAQPRLRWRVTGIPPHHTSLRATPAGPCRPVAIPLINRPDPRRSHFHQVPIRISKVKALPTPIPCALLLDGNPLLLQPRLPPRQLRGRNPGHDLQPALRSEKARNTGGEQHPPPKCLAIRPRKEPPAPTSKSPDQPSPGSPRRPVHPQGAPPSNLWRSKCQPWSLLAHCCPGRSSKTLVRRSTLDCTCQTQP